ncbi:MAG TPA: hypothetical protein DCS07_02495 [Bdellovibrionales bacterium]|nr:MAG: hypothetical protein A2Z97_15235 [Bdellovibrionales bacterium GWB1_52_6]OFZ05934.1 MAG: hypothetical protein A2X97_01180 [Bdellovibrionales bacterium GWA1_52_35]OFZ37086.1 MAG: hypothetical protein A2070_06375 [Bdellovibrionales bacterium GWC1_52_8]HAR41493.1 hypothetical protein [Bdellovibrionales bacterium]HCM39448.1 hypothetical protein [Bdellovibrionales bacterium]
MFPWPRSTLILLLLALSYAHDLSWADPIIERMDDRRICQKLLGPEFFTVITQFAHPNGGASVACEKDAVFQGPYSSFYSDGRKKSQGQLKNNKLVGHWKRWHSNGLLESEGDWDEGRPDGYWKIFSSNGRLLEYGRFQKGTKYCDYHTWSRYGARPKTLESSCIPVRDGPTIKIETGADYSKLNVLFAKSQIPITLVSNLNLRAGVTASSPLRIFGSRRLKVFGSVEFTTEQLHSASSDELYLQENSTVQALKIGTHFSLSDILDLTLGAVRSSEYFLVGEQSGILALGRYPLYGGLASLNMKVFEKSGFEIQVKGAVTLYSPGTLSGFNLVSGRQLMIATDFLRLSDSRYGGAQFGLRPYFQRAAYQSNISESINSGLGLTFIYEVKL